ncbi:MAG: hypothetical protein JO372_12735 [Solirubrobacterales bacterium]|nr:hypothetical protein [Solirubrobacterales bacterium]
MAAIACLTVLAACGSGAFTGSSRSRVAAGSRDCPGQDLSCEQLIALGLSYPYPREPTSYLYVNGAAYPYLAIGHSSLADASVRIAGTVLTVRELLQRLGEPGQADVARAPVIAYGSNANVDALTRKFLNSNFRGEAVIPVIKGTLHGFDVAWSPQFVFNGAMPATIVPSAGTSVSVWITWLDAAELQRMNATEGVGSLYSFGVLRHARLQTPGPRVTRPGIYVDCFGALRAKDQVLAIRAIPARHRRFVTTGPAEALARVAPLIGWHGSVFDLVLDNVRAPAHRASRSRALNALAIEPAVPGYSVIHPCTRS